MAMLGLHPGLVFCRADRFRALKRVYVRFGRFRRAIRHNSPPVHNILLPRGRAEAEPAGTPTISVVNVEQTRSLEGVLRPMYFHRAGVILAG